jgi:hypothetical protein
MRRAAVISTAIAVPLVVVLALALAPKSGKSSASTQAVATTPVSVAAPTPSPAAVEPCAHVLSALPVQLDGLNPRIVHPSPDDSAAVVAWGDPAIVLQCGVGRPPSLVTGSSAFAVDVDGVSWLPTAGSKETVFVVVDRAVYISVTVPKSYQQPPLATISDAIADALPSICSLAPDTDSSASASPSASATDPALPLCTHRP